MIHSIPKSITNSNVSVINALDAQEPFSFLQFIKIFDTPVDDLQTHYIEYLKQWNRLKNIKESDDAIIIVERYRDFIKDVNLEFVTTDEKKFLSRIDFNDPLDLDLVIPFYSRKLIEITNYYNRKREENKYQVIKKNIAGTTTLLEQELRNNIINFLENVDDGSLYFDIDDIKNNLDVEVGDLYDAYPLYFNQNPDTTYDNKDLDWGYDIFLKNNTDLINGVFSGLTPEFLNLKEINDLIDNKRKLTKKYIGNDFYYLSTGATNTSFISGMAFSADHPVRNFTNINYPTTASTDKKVLVSEEEIGFFRPHKTSIINVDGKNLNFNFNFENIQPNSVYYFPDPLRGDGSNIITFVNDDDYSRRNFTSGKAQNIPKSNKNDNKYYGYISRIDLNRQKYLEDIFESGYIQDSKKDIYNNLYGLLKDGNNFTKTLTSYNTPSKYYQILNGHTFYDYTYGEGFSFNYSTVDDTTYDTTKRSGLSTYTNSFSAIDLYYQLFGGSFNQDKFYYSAEYLPTFEVFDGIYLMDGNAAYIDAASSDLSSFELSGSFYYSQLIEGGINKKPPLRRALLDAAFPTITANMVENVTPDYTNTFLVDGLFFGSDYEDLLPVIPEIYYDNNVLSASEYTLSSNPTENYYERFDRYGVLYVKNSSNGEILSIQELPYLKLSLNSSVWGSLSAVKRFDIFVDTLFIETNNSIIITKLEFDGADFIPSTEQTFSRSHYNKISNRYKVDDKIYFTIIDNISSNATDAKVSSTIYEFDATRHKLNTYTPSTPNIRTNSPTFSSVDAPTLSYYHRKDIYNISYMIKNPSKEFILVENEYKMPFEEIRFSQYSQL